MLQNSFYAPIRPPAHVPFPNSDAGYYDSMAQSLLIGYPYLGEIPSRPLYVVFLAGLHSLLGERYDLIIAGQTLVLAIIPVLLYWLGSAIHSRPAGVIAAIAAVGREWTSLMVSSATRVSNYQDAACGSAHSAGDAAVLSAGSPLAAAIGYPIGSFRGRRLRVATAVANSDPGAIARPAIVCCAYHRVSSLGDASRKWECSWAARLSSWLPG